MEGLCGVFVVWFVRVFGGLCFRFCLVGCGWLFLVVGVYWVLEC